MFSHYLYAVLFVKETCAYASHAQIQRGGGGGGGLGYGPHFDFSGYGFLAGKTLTHAGLKLTPQPEKIPGSAQGFLNLSNDARNVGCLILRDLK